MILSEKTPLIKYHCDDKEDLKGRTVRTEEKQKKLLLGLLLLVLLAVVLISFSLGRYSVPLTVVLQAVAHQIFPQTVVSWEPQVEIALFHIRLPRILMGILVGAGLSLSGASFQALFRNPLVSPDVLGASGGAAFGAALAILLGMGTAMITLTSFAFGLLSLLLVFLISRRIRMDAVLSLILCGIVVGSLFTAALSYLKLIADPSSELPAITYWLMGSLASARFQDLAFAAPPILLGSLLIWSLRWPLNLFTLGEEQALSMGVPVKILRLLLLLAATLTTSAAVSVCGLIGWIGLVIPHISLLLFGADYRLSLSGTALIGAIFTLLVDDAARLMASSEVPIGILTALLGAPIFLGLLLREGRRLS